MHRFETSRDRSPRTAGGHSRLTPGLIVALVAALLAVLGTSVLRPTVASAAPAEITEAPSLQWGFKQSWRDYTRDYKPAVSRGATLLGESGTMAGYDVGWSFSGGSYDEATRATVLRYEGTAHWQKYRAEDYQGLAPLGYQGPWDIYILDVEISDPIITISREASTISVRAKSRDIATWQLVDHGRVDIAELGSDRVTPTASDGDTTWTAIPAVSTPEAKSVFGNEYPVGTTLDRIDVSYSGPGGAPDFTERFDPPGTQKLEAEGENVQLAPPTTVSSFFRTWAIDPIRRLAHYGIRAGATWTYRAFDLDTMQAIGEPLQVSGSSGLGFLVVNDQTSGTLYFQAPGTLDVRRWVRYDREQGAYVQGDLDAPIPVRNTITHTWDTVGKRALDSPYRTVPDGASPTDYDQHQWILPTYAETSPGTWTRKDYRLPNLPSGLNQSGYGQHVAVLSDGTLLLNGTTQTSSNPDAVPTPERVPGAYRIALDDEHSTATATPIEGTTVDNELVSVYNQPPVTGPDGRAYLRRSWSNWNPAVVQALAVDSSSGGITVHDPIDLDNFDGVPAGQEAVDPEDGTLWLGGLKSKRLVGIRDGRIVSDSEWPNRNTRSGTLVAGPDHTLVMQSDDGAPGLATTAFGFQKLRRVGISPTIATAPQDAAVTLGTGEDSIDVTFTAAATGDPAPNRQWQAKAPGASRFRDIVGETGETLTVTAQPSGGGTEYRAVFSNAGGRIATEPATLTVRFAPRVTFDPIDQTTAPGQDATFEVMSTGNPEPAVQWQRRVGGFWQAIDPDDDNFEVADGRLTVKDTNLEQSGTLFRARLRNDVGTSYTRTAQLTVKAPQAQALSGVRLDWTGSAELQRTAPNQTGNFFSAGVSAGDQASYAAATRGVQILHVSDDGRETATSWEARERYLQGGRQLVRLTGGTGRIEADGSTSVSWPGTFSVNMYGGLVPFTISDLALTVDAEGNGRLTGTLSGYASSMANPNARTPIAPVPGVTIATFSGVRVDPGQPTTIAPHYRGVRVEVPAGQAPQDREVDGWGSWPQGFVDFQQQTGLGSYWYSSGGAADPHKAPHAFVVAVTGETVEPEPLPLPTPDPPVITPLPPLVPTPPADTPRVGATLAVQSGRRQVSRYTRRVLVATLKCRQGPCRITVPKRVKVWIGGRSYRVTISGARTVRTGGATRWRAQLSRAALRQLKGRTARLSTRIVVRTPTGNVTRNIRITLR